MADTSDITESVAQQVGPPAPAAVDAPNGTPADAPAPQGPPEYQPSFELQQIYSRINGQPNLDDLDKQLGAEVRQRRTVAAGLQEVTDLCTRREQELSAARHEIAEAQGEIGRLREELVQWKGRVAEMQDQLLSSNDRTLDLQRQLEDVRAQHAGEEPRATDGEVTTTDAP